MVALEASPRSSTLERVPKAVEIVPDGATHQIQERGKEQIAQTQRELRGTADARAFGNRIQPAVPGSILEIPGVPSGAGQAQGGFVSAHRTHLVRHAAVFRTGAGARVPHGFERKADAGYGISRRADLGYAAIPERDVAHVSEERRDVVWRASDSDLSLQSQCGIV